MSQPPIIQPEVVRYSDRPELWDSLEHLSSEVWPEYNLHGDVLNQYWDRLYTTFPEWQFVLVDAAAGQVLAEGHTIPVAWDGTDVGLGPGIDASIAAGFALRAAGGTPSAVCALAAEIPPRHQGRGLSPVMLQAMAGLATGAGLAGPSDRAGPAEPEGALPDHRDRALCGLDPGGWDTVRPGEGPADSRNASAPQTIYWVCLGRPP